MAGKTVYGVTDPDDEQVIKDCVDILLEPAFECSCCGIAVPESNGDWIGDIYGSPFYCEHCLEEYHRLLDCDGRGEED